MFKGTFAASKRCWMRRPEGPHAVIFGKDPTILKSLGKIVTKGGINIGRIEGLVLALSNGYFVTHLQ